jgi:hypothetical protein
VGKKENCVILEYFSLGKCPVTGPWGRLEKFLFIFENKVAWGKKCN